MSATAVMSEPASLADMPPVIVSMLRDEANLLTARHVLDDARNDSLNRLETLRAERPAFGFLGSKKHREDYTAAMNAVEAQLRAIDAMIARVTAARDRLQPGLRAGLVDFVGRVDPMYRQGLRASRFNEHWRRAHAVLADRVKAFIRDTKGAQTAVTSDVNARRSAHSVDTSWNLTNARNAAIELDRELKSLNDVSFDHQSSVAGTPFVQLRLPVIEAWNCIQKIDTLMVKPPAEALIEVNRLLGEFTELRQPSLTTLLNLFEAVAAEHAQLAETRLRQCWSSLLGYAEAHLVSDADLEPTLADIERRQAEAERTRFNTFNPRPFDSER